MWAAADPPSSPGSPSTSRAVGEDWAAFYEAVFGPAASIAAPFTYAHVGGNPLTAVGDGLAVRSSVDPGAVPADVEVDGEGRWTLLGAALVALSPPSAGLSAARPPSSPTTWPGCADLARSTSGLAAG